MNKYKQNIIIFVAQRDYVRRGQLANGKYQRHRIRKKQNSFSVISPTITATTLFLIIALTGGLHFITYYKKKETQAFQANEVTNIVLPIKPEERWRYIKELESRQVDWNQSTGPFEEYKVRNLNQLGNEQHQILEEIQSDMQKRSTRLNAIKWNKKTMKKFPTVEKNHRQDGWVQIQSEKSEKIQTYQKVMKIPEPSKIKQYKKPKQNVKIIQAKNKKKEITHQKNKVQWIVQCGSFKSAKKAEILRAHLALEGFDSFITRSQGWNRVVLGQAKEKNNIDFTIAKLKTAGYTDCIRLISGVESSKIRPIYFSIQP